MICISSNNNRHPVPKTFAALCHTSLHFTTFADTSLLPIKSHLTTLHYTSPIISFGLTPSTFPTAPFHLTSLHFTSHEAQMTNNVNTCHTSEEGFVFIIPIKPNFSFEVFIYICNYSILKQTGEVFF